MKMSPDDGKAGEAMAPGKISISGFLGTETMSLPDIVSRDEAALAALGLSFDAVAEKLAFLAREGGRGLGAAVKVNGRWSVAVDEARGVIPCPFRDGRFHKRNITVTRIESGRSIVYSDLSLHLLSSHHFLQGRGSPFRLDPAALKAVLED